MLIIVKLFNKSRSNNQLRDPYALCKLFFFLIVCDIYFISKAEYDKKSAHYCKIVEQK